MGATAEKSDLRPTGQSRSLRQVTQGVEWRGWQVRLLTYSLLLVQAAQAAWSPANDYAKSYWLLNYDRGFMRRGLAGELADLLPLSPERATEVAAGLAAVVSVGAIIALIEVLLRRQTTAGAAMAVLLAASPFVVDQLLSQRRPDQLGLVLLIATGFVSRRSSPSRWAFATLGLLFAAGVLVHEGIGVYYLPGAAFLLLLRHDRREVDLPSLLFLVGPGLIAAAFATAFGTVTEAESAAMLATLPFPDPEWNIALVMDEGLGESVRKVASLGVRRLAAMFLLGAALLGAQAWFIRYVARVRPLELARSTGPTWVRRSIIAMCVAGAAAVYATGTDWMRWICILGAVYLCIAAFVALDEERSDDTTRSPIVLPLWIIPVVLYAALIPPLPDLSVSEAVKDLLLIG